MWYQGHQEQAELLVGAAARHRERKRTGKSLRRGVVWLLASTALGLVCVFLFGAGDSNDASAAACGSAPTRPGDACTQHTKGQPTGSSGRQKLLVQEHDGRSDVRSFGWALIGIGLLMITPVYYAYNPKTPWGIALTEPCEWCGRAARREKRTFLSKRRDGVELVGVVVLCTPECGYSAVRPPA